MHPDPFKMQTQSTKMQLECEGKLIPQVVPGCPKNDFWDIHNLLGPKKYPDGSKIV